MGLACLLEPMDDQHPAAPASDPAPPVTPRPLDPQGSAGATSPRSRRRVRAASVAAATALVAGAAGVGAGYAVGRRTSTSPAPTSATGTGPGGSSFDGANGAPGTVDGWGWSGDVPGTGPTVPGSSEDVTTRASASMLTGLVRVVSSMPYAGARAAGTGMVLTSDGEVVTNHHVVEGATTVRVTVMSTGKTYAAAVVGSDARDDVALLRLTGASGLSTVRTDTGGVSLGDDVTAVGDANGTTGYFSAASGRVTARDRSITTRTDGTASGERLAGLMQISSDVVSGDSGGATYDAQGEVVGMTTAASSGGARVDGYAVPIRTVLRVVDDLESGVESGRYDYGRPAFLGVGLDGSTTMLQGVYTGTPAFRAGLRAGDRITSLGGRHVTTSAALKKAVSDRSPGDRVRVAWTDGSGAEHSATVTLTAGPVE